MSDHETKRCPDCAERIQAAAKKCRFCGYRFDHAEAPEGESIAPPGSSATSASAPDPESEAPATMRGGKALAALSVLGVVALVAIVVAQTGKPAGAREQPLAQGATAETEGRAEPAPDRLPVPDAEAVLGAVRGIEKMCNHPPPDSEASEEYFSRGIGGYYEAEADLSFNVETLVGAYRDHPDGIVLNHQSEEVRVEDLLLDAAAELDPESCLNPVMESIGTEKPAHGAAEAQRRLERELNVG